MGWEDKRVRTELVIFQKLGEEALQSRDSDI